MTCRHANYMIGRPSPDADTGIIVTTCIHCHALLPMGPASDDSSRVQIEIRAAELAIMTRLELAWDTTDYEYLGWRMERDSQTGAGAETDAAVTGMLAYLITHHE